MCVSPALGIQTTEQSRKPGSLAVLLPRMLSVIRPISMSYSLNLSIINNYAVRFCSHALHCVINNLSVNTGYILISGCIHLTTAKTDWSSSSRPCTLVFSVLVSVLEVSMVCALAAISCFRVSNCRQKK